jgi:hypothetical protein
MVDGARDRSHDGAAKADPVNELARSADNERSQAKACVWLTRRVDRSPGPSDMEEELAVGPLD